MSRRGIVTSLVGLPLSDFSRTIHDDQNQLQRLSFSARNHPTGDLALYVQFTLSFRDVEDLLAERGIMVSYESRYN